MQNHSTTHWLAGALLALLSCSGAPPKSGAEEVKPPPPAPAKPKAPPPLSAPNNPPDFEIPAYRAVGVGQQRLCQCRFDLLCRYGSLGLGIAGALTLRVVSKTGTRWNQSTNNDILLQDRKSVV